MCWQYPINIYTSPKTGATPQSQTNENDKGFPDSKHHQTKPPRGLMSQRLLKLLQRSSGDFISLHKIYNITAFPLAEWYPETLC